MEEKRRILRSNSSIVKATRGGTRRREGRVVDIWKRQRERERERVRHEGSKRVKGGPARVGRRRASNIGRSEVRRWQRWR